MLTWEGCGGPQLPSRLAAVCTRLLHLPDTSGAFVWRLLLQALVTMPQELGPHLDGISTAAAQQLGQGSPIMQQGLVCFFAMLLTIDPGQTLAFLQQQALPGRHVGSALCESLIMCTGSQMSLLERVLQVWVERQGDFSRPQELKLTCTALGYLLNANLAALDTMTALYVCAVSTVLLNLRCVIGTVHITRCTTCRQSQRCAPGQPPAAGAHPETSRRGPRAVLHRDHAHQAAHAAG